jgi:hypothetical protein
MPRRGRDRNRELHLHGVVGGVSKLDRSAERRKALVPGERSYLKKRKLKFTDYLVRCRVSKMDPDGD